MADLFVWQKNLKHVVDTHDVIIVHGNVRDLYMYCDSPRRYEVGLDELLTRMFFSDYGAIRRYDPYSKASDLSMGEADTFVVNEADGFGSVGFNSTLDPTIARILADTEHTGQPRVWLLQYMHDVLPFRSSYSEQDCLRLIAFQRMIERIHPGNKLILCYLGDGQVPIELSRSSYRVGFINIPIPDFEERRMFWETALEPGIAKDIAKLTDGLALTALRTLVQLPKKDERHRGIELTALSMRDWSRIIDFYKFGESQDYYQQISTSQLNKADEFFIHKEGVQGQNYAVSKVISMLWKARTNVSSLLRGADSNPPRGVLFFCGPSGVGKTMVCKKLAKFVFGSEDAFVRIDMSEYQQDHAISRLIGSPPGYVGHEAGGELTNAVRERPFCVVLFDEVEKAHPRVFDLLLQLLSDGRLTDSRGVTVFFSQAIVVFTSNIGTRSSEIERLMEVQRSGEPERVREHFRKCVRDFFRYEISRPELLNRLGNNIVAFNYLDSDEVLLSTVKFYLSELNERFNQEYESKGLRLEILVDEVAQFITAGYGKDIREFGGRAVVNTLDDTLLPLLAHRILELEGTPAKLVVRVRVDGGRRVLWVDAG